MTDAIQPVWADWAAPKHIKACSLPRASSLNTTLCTHLHASTDSGNPPAATLESQKWMMRTLHVSAIPFMLHQTHSARVVPCPPKLPEAPPHADASFTQYPGQPLCIFTADCLPILLTNTSGEIVAAVHAGWRGLAMHIIPTAVELICQRSACTPDQVIAWIGPGISQPHYQVDQPVFDAFPHYQCAQYFKRDKSNHWRLNCAAIAQAQLEAAGVNAISQSGLCTYSDPQNWYSYRRDGPNTGRIASLIWIERSDAVNSIELSKEYAP